MIARYNMVDIVETADWAEAIFLRETAFAQTPEDISCISRMDALELSDSMLYKDRLTIVWQSCKCFGGSTSRKGNNAMNCLKLPTNLAVESLKGKALEETDVFLPHEECMEAIGIEPNIDTLTPMKRTERLGDPTLDRSLVGRFLKLGTELTIIGAVMVFCQRWHPASTTTSDFANSIGAPSPRRPKRRWNFGLLHLTHEEPLKCASHTNARNSPS